MLRIFIHSRSKRAETVALLDSGATENFMNIRYAQKMNLPIQRLIQERRLFNIDGTPNKAGSLKYLLCSRLGTRWSDVDVTKSLKAGDRGMVSLQETEVLLCDRDDTRSSPHLSVVALGCLNGGDERGEGQGHYLS